MLSAAMQVAGRHRDLLALHGPQLQALRLLGNASWQTQTPLGMPVHLLLVSQEQEHQHDVRAQPTPWPAGFAGQMNTAGFAAAGVLQADPSGKRHLSFMRHLSGEAKRPKRLDVPDAADADDALAEYTNLKDRLDRLNKPATMRSNTEVLKDILKGTRDGLMTVGGFIYAIPAYINAHRQLSSEEKAAKRKAMWATVKQEAHHYWVGAKLLRLEVSIASRHAWRAAQGKQLSRRERAQLTRTTADLIRLVPMVIILVIPLLEFTLPVLLRLFPNMLPSTFEDKLKKEEELKRRLAVRLQLARFLQDTVAEMATDMARHKGSSKDAADLAEFLRKVRSGQEVDNAEIVRFARLFNNELTLDHLERVQLVGMCQFVGISVFGTDTFLRNRLRSHLQQIKRDDCEVEEEGLENLTEDELRAACRARGIRTPFGENAVRFMQSQMRDWLDLSLHRGLPSSLLLLSRAFTITARKPAVGPQDVSTAKDASYEKVKETLGVIPEEAVDHAMEASGHGRSVEDMKSRLEFLRREEEAIKAEQRRQETAQKAALAQEKQMRAAVTQGDMPSATPASAAEGETAVAQSIADEEAAEAAAQAREHKLRVYMSALMDMATGSGVASERGVFMGLMRKEIERVNDDLVSKGKESSTGTMTFTGKGLEFTKGHEPSEEQAADEQGVLAQLTQRTSRMLESIEKELDAVEHKIGKSLHLIDTDGDGKVSTAELEKAMSFLREQLSTEELGQLLTQVRKAAKSADAEQTGATGQGAGHEIEVTELLDLAHRRSKAEEASKADKN